MNKALVSYIVISSVILSLFIAYVGRVYVESRGAPQDGREAVMQLDENIKELAEQGDADAQNNLGEMYTNGEGVPQDYKKAVNWYLKAAEQGHASAQFSLGQVYAEGRGVPQDDKKAIKWYSMAVEQIYANAQYNPGSLSDSDDQGDPGSLSDSDDQGDPGSLSDSDDQGDPGSLIDSDDQDVSQDHKEAVNWLRKVAEQGDVNAQYMMGIMYDVGAGVSEDNVQAYMFLSLAASGGYEGATAERDKIAKDMSRAQIKETKKLIEEWASKHPRQ